MNLDIRIELEGSSGFLRREFHAERNARSTCAWIIKYLCPLLTRHRELDAIIQIVMQLKSLNFKPVIRSDRDFDSMTLSIIIDQWGMDGIEVRAGRPEEAPLMDFTKLNGADFSKLAKSISMEVC